MAHGTVTSCSPTSGPQQGGTVVTVNGSGFTTYGIKYVHFGVANGTIVPFTVLSNTQFQITTVPSQPNDPNQGIYNYVTVVWASDGAGSSTGFTVTGLLAPPPGRGVWRLTLHQRQFDASYYTQTILAQLDGAFNRKLEQNWCESAQLTFDMNGRDPACALIQELQMDVVAWRWDEWNHVDVPVFRGLVGQSEDKLDESGHTVTFTCHDYFSMLGRRLYTSRNQLVYTTTEQDLIANQLCGVATYAADSNGNSFGAASWFPLQTKPVNPDGTNRGASGVQRTMTIQGGSQIDTMLNNLAQLTGGFDWDVVPFADQPTLSIATADVLRLFYPYQGVTRTTPVLNYGGAVMQVNRQVSTGAYANYWRTIGNNESALQNAPQVIGEAQTADAVNIIVGTFMSGDQLADQNNTAWLGYNAQGQLNQSGVLLPGYQLKLTPGFYYWGIFNMGDSLPLVIQSGRLNVNTNVRILGITYNIGDDGQEDVELAVGRPRFSLLKLMRAQAADVRALSRR